MNAIEFAIRLLPPKFAAEKEPTFNDISFSLENIFQNSGIEITIVGYIIVFASLALLYFVFSALAKALIAIQFKKTSKSGSKAKTANELEVSGETGAAIATALYLYFYDKHDIEDAVLKIKKAAKPYSPWSSKLYGITKFPEKISRR